MVVLWAITIPQYHVEHFAIFRKARGDDAVNNLFPVVVVLQYVCLVAIITARGHRGIPVVIFLWEVGVVTVFGGDGWTMGVR